MGKEADWPSLDNHKYSRDVGKETDWHLLDNWGRLQLICTNQTMTETN